MIRHARGYRAYARNDQTPRHKAVASWSGLVGTPGQPTVTVWYCACGFPVTGAEQEGMKR